MVRPCAVEETNWFCFGSRDYPIGSPCMAHSARPWAVSAQEEEQPHTASENNSSETNFFIKITFDNSRLIPPSNCFKTTSKTKNFAEGLKYQVVCVCVSDLVRETRISEVF